MNTSLGSKATLRCNHSSNMNFVTIFLLFLSSDFTAVKCTQDILKVSLYYESLCPGSSGFVTDQLYPGYVKIPEALILDFVPYGKANQTLINGKWKFTCQHGCAECQGNKIQACVLARRISRLDKSGFVNCMMGSNDASSLANGQKCAVKYKVVWADIQRCVQGEEGDILLAHYGDRTKALSPPLKYVPHILFNGVFNETLEDDARDDFLKTACSLLNVRPSGCDKKE